MAVVVRGDHEVNEVKVKHILGSEKLEIASSDIVSKATGAPYPIQYARTIIVWAYL
ncbi:YbaK/EbsC family protein [Paenibacillus sp. NRS-1782]|uniref:YbaK/EbsC family protein n=1 Tax=unclassified Paenibacillus TaxID=185978 RepID=UPI003D29C473